MVEKLCAIAGNVSITYFAGITVDTFERIYCEDEVINTAITRNLIKDVRKKNLSWAYERTDVYVSMLPEYIKKYLSSILKKEICLNRCLNAYEYKKCKNK